VLTHHESSDGGHLRRRATGRQGAAGAIGSPLPARSELEALKIHGISAEILTDSAASFEVLSKSTAQELSSPETRSFPVAAKAPKNRAWAQTMTCAGDACTSTAFTGAGESSSSDCRAGAGRTHASALRLLFQNPVVHSHQSLPVPTPGMQTRQMWMPLNGGYAACVSRISTLQLGLPVAGSTRTSQIVVPPSFLPGPSAAARKACPGQGVEAKPGSGGKDIELTRRCAKSTTTRSPRPARAGITLLSSSPPISRPLP